MTLYTVCKSCKEEIPVKAKAITRSDLEWEKKDINFNVNCHNCGNHQKIHVNEVRAKPNFKLTYLGIIVSLIMVILFWKMGFISGLVILIPAFIAKSEMGSVDTFNKYLLNR